MLLRFNFIIPDSIKADLLTNSLNIDSATVQLYRSYVYGDSTSKLNYTVRSIKASAPWATGFTIDSLSGIQSQSDPVALISTSESDTLYQFKFDPSLVGTWLNNFAASGTPDNGIMVIPQNDTKIIGFYALTSVTTVQIPNLRVVLSKPGVYSNDTLNFTTTADVSVVSGNIPAQNQPENIYVQSSVELESRIQFDLSKVPKNAIINYAELQLTIDPVNSVLGSPLTDQLIAEFITDSTHIDSLSTYPVTLNRVGSLYTGNITLYVQNWLSTKINEGIQIKSGSYDTGVELWALKGSNAADHTLRPRLKIIYTNKK